MRNLRLLLVSSVATLLLITSVAAQENGPSQNLAATPPMGWNSWNKFACNVGDELIRGMADAMVKSGMKDAGYEYINIDDCWQVGRDASGNVIVDPQRFPHGMKAVGDYIHSLGLKFGVYSDAGSQTCAGRPGGLGHEYQDAIQYAAWGVDYLKYDWCHTSTQDAKASYANIRAALDASGRPIVLSICEWGTAKPWLWGREVGGNMWRTTGDIQDRWQGKREWKPGDCCSYGVLDIVDAEAPLYSYAGPGHWNDPDMLELGNGGTDCRQRPARHAAGNSRHSHQQRGDRGRSGPAGPPGRACGQEWRCRSLGQADERWQPRRGVAESWRS